MKDMKKYTINYDVQVDLAFKLTPKIFLTQNSRLDIYFYIDQLPNIHLAMGI